MPPIEIILHAQGELLKNRPLILLPFLLSAATALLAFASDSTMIQSIGQIGFGFGSSVDSLVRLGRFGMPTPQGWSYAHRMPFIILFLYLLNQIFRHLWLVYLAKNIVCSCAVIYVLKRARAPLSYSAALLAFVYAVPFNTSVASRLDSEEAYLFFMLMAALWMVLDRKTTVLSNIALGLLLAAIYLTKSSTGLLCIALGSMVLIQGRAFRRPKWISMLPLACVVIAALGWASYIEQKTGVFAIGTSASSWNGWNFHKGNNPYSLNLYPSVNLDTLDGTPYLTPAGSELCRDEWCLAALQMQAGKEFLSTHPKQVLLMDFKKLEVIFWRLHEAPVEHLAPRMRITLSLFLDHAVFLAALIVCIAVRPRGASVFGVSVACYILPFFSSFLYHRHMLPAYGMSAVFLFYCATEKWRRASGEEVAQTMHRHTTN